MLSAEHLKKLDLISDFYGDSKFFLVRQRHSDETFLFNWFLGVCVWPEEQFNRSVPIEAVRKLEQRTVVEAEDPMKKLILMDIYLNGRNQLLFQGVRRSPIKFHRSDCSDQVYVVGNMVVKRYYVDFMTNVMGCKASYLLINRYSPIPVSPIVFRGENCTGILMTQNNVTTMNSGIPNV